MVSIIIPVRNHEKYVARCVKSIQSQTYTNLDIIIVLNDSSDQSRAICKKLESTDSRIRIMDIKEAGVSRARNVGIELALGDYIVFVDADDFVHSFLIQRLYTEANKNEADIVVANYEKYAIDALGREHNSKLMNRRVSANLYAKGMLLGSQGYDGYIWSKMYRSKVLSKTRFDERLSFSEDTDFLLRLLRQDLQVFISQFVGYFYSQDTSGITKDSSGKQRLESLALSETFIREAVNDGVRAAAQCYYWRNAYYILSQNNISSGDQNRVWNAMRRYRTVVIMDISSPIKYRLIALLSLIGKGIFIRIMSRLASGN
ncbi:MAG TPA: glycosyltransferase family 2 protein [Candidatus Chromulinivoraceae bacterium]|nr:glycosyltransferase family 2 protein [Candidatus Chromulinivoraceae bacterium]